MTCLACDGDGWVLVASGYAERMVPDPASAKLETVDEASQSAIWDRVYQRRDHAARSVVPCKVCRPDLYLRWAGGHLDRLHNTAGCETCSGGMKPRRSFPETDRRDLE